MQAMDLSVMAERIRSSVDLRVQCHKSMTGMVYLYDL